MPKVPILAAAVPDSRQSGDTSYDGARTSGKNGSNLSRFGIHEVSKENHLVTFTFRFPKPGIYKLLIYARNTGEQVSEILLWLI
ncbi:unnamed protein product [Protopolystoma xenopodis]|uniref:KY-like immunoglobulin-like domain-containing protein n=1 Tax=Protopolystoma xenopodis TaxID=117903 RepID=A0A448XRS0_9PLAT|nr:unnamed protein product [Protopolystoma xenopodis]